MIHRFPGLLKDKTAAGTIRWRVRVEGNRNKKIAIPVVLVSRLFTSTMRLPG